MSTKHTPEPWELLEGASSAIIHPTNGIGIAHTYGSAANAARIVECVNAFEGIESPKAFMEVVKQLKLDAYQEIEHRCNALILEDKHIRAFLHADESESTYDEVVRQFTILTKQVERLNQERQHNAALGQSALDEANDRLIQMEGAFEIVHDELTKFKDGLTRKLVAMRNAWNGEPNHAVEALQIIDGMIQELLGDGKNP
jgi:hypothetical protein